MKQKPVMDRAELPKTASLKQLTDLMREIQQQDACDMEVDLAEEMWQESDAIVWSTLAHELETVVECPSAQEDDVEDIEMPGGALCDGSEGEEQEPMTDGEQRDGSVAEHAGHSKRDLERVKKALMRLHVNLGRLGVEELIRVLKHGRASKLAFKEPRQMRCDVCAENVQPKLPRPALPRQVLDFTKCMNIVCHGIFFVSDDHTALVGNDDTGSAESLQRRLAALGTSGSCSSWWKFARPFLGSPGAELRCNGDHRGSVSLAS